jgi:hypothetical protein
MSDRNPRGAEHHAAGGESMASLSYYIFEGVLTGTVGGTFFQMTALSGGGGGSRNRRLRDDSVNHPYRIGRKTVGSMTAPNHVHGGPLPPGRYRIDTPETTRGYLAAKLTPTGQAMLGRDGMLIHGTGKHGSDGCIVPLQKDQFAALMDALTRSKGGMLYVWEAMGGGRFA